MGAEVTLLSGMIFGIDEDGVVRTGGHASLTADADGLVEINDAVGAFEHGRGRAGSHAGRVRALIAARHLMSAAHLGEHAHIDMLNVGARDPDRNDVFRFTRSRARMTADATGVVDDLGPLHAFSASCFLPCHVWIWLCRLT